MHHCLPVGLLLKYFPETRGNKYRLFCLPGALSADILNRNGFHPSSPPSSFPMSKSFLLKKMCAMKLSGIIIPLVSSSCSYFQCSVNIMFSPANIWCSAIVLALSLIMKAHPSPESSAHRSRVCYARYFSIPYYWSVSDIGPVQSGIKLWYSSSQNLKPCRKMLQLKWNMSTHRNIRSHWKLFWHLVAGAVDINVASQL